MEKENNKSNNTHRCWAEKEAPNHFYSFLSRNRPSPCIFMHIMEGFLPIEWALFWWGVTLPSLIIGLLSIKKKLQEHPEFKMMLGLSGAFAFVLSALKK
ncbi:hypothetical protein AP3564_14995 [Aeribacillus pallidus]|uniref:Uncharacterized protein n=1 Tax=Aeribacillus pallidus TaxID=33936 RepID=A0A223E823_9BACI|nr:hypothetical protein AP3564_14995 [Aeribacillus pallidus]